MSLAGADTGLFLFINKGLKNGFLDAAMPFVTKHPVFLFLPFALWVFYRRRDLAPRLLVLSVVAVALADSSGNLLKHLFERPRPCNVLENINLLVGCGQSFSMPSNHASNSFGVAGVFAYFCGGVTGGIFFFLASVIGFSRIYVGVHYPGDVAAGAALGLIAACGAVLLYRLASRIRERKSYGEALALFLVLVSLFRAYYIVTGPFDLSPDEAHYWEWSRHLDWSYYSKGPLIAWLIRAGTALFGNTVFGVRIFAVVLSALSSVVLYRLASDLYDERTGFLSALLVQAVPLYSVYGVLLTIDSPFIFFWILSLYFFWKAVQVPGSGNGGIRYWVLLGLAAGLGLLAKYTMAFFFMSGLLFLCLDRNARRLLLSKGPYSAALISAVVFSPVIYWNARNGWVTVKHTAGQAHIRDGLTLSAGHFFEFLGSQLGVVTPVLFVAILFALWRLGRGSKRTFLLAFSLPVLIFFLLKSVQGKVQANWALPAYAAGFVAFAAYYSDGERLAKKGVKILVAVSVGLALFITACAYFPSILNLPRKLDPSARLTGWQKLGAEADRIYSEMPSDRQTFIFSDSYQVASELAFYMKGNPVTYCINLGRRMNQYDLWPGFEDLEGHCAILVMRGEQEMPAGVASAFGRYEKIPVSIETGRGRMVKFTLFKCYDFKGIEMKPAKSY